MRLMEGRIGRQESASMLGMALYVSSVFTLDSERIYSRGNSSYIWLPAALLLAMSLFLIMGYVLRRTGKENIRELLNYSLGKAAGGAFAGVTAAFLLLNAYAVVSGFVSTIHGFVYYDAQYLGIVLWIVLVVTLISLRGLECIGRTAKCFGVFLGIILLIALIMPIDGYELYRLYPLPGEPVGTIARRTLGCSARTLPAFLCIFWMQEGMQGKGAVKKTGLISGIIIAALVLLTQLAIGLAYTYTELNEMLMPLYRLNSILLTEGYFLRQDKIFLFLWLIACVIGGAFYIYGASLICAKHYYIRDIRPVDFSFCALLLGLVYLEHTGIYDLMQACLIFVKRYGYLFLWLPLCLAAVSALIKMRAEQKKSKEEQG